MCSANSPNNQYQCRTYQKKKEKKRKERRVASGFVGNMLLFGSVIRSFFAGLLSENK
jgi:hypothetical protein